jgi:predicted DNA binding CopG/RHH family protein
MLKLDKEEKEIINEINNNEWIPLSEKEENDLLSSINGKGKERKIQRINLRLIPNDVILVKEKAKQEGIPYQTLISSIVHKYLTGQFLERDTVETIIKKIRN